MSRFLHNFMVIQSSRQKTIAQQLDLLELWGPIQVGTFLAYNSFRTFK